MNSRRDDQVQWFAYRTNVSVGGGVKKKPRRWAQWLGVVVVGTTCAGLALGAFYWLVTLDLDGLLQAGRGLIEATAAR